MESSSQNGFTTKWNIEDLITSRTDVPLWAVKNIVHMLENAATIPFIARYRKESTGGLEVDKLREINSLLEELKAVQQKTFTVLMALQKQNKLTDQLQNNIRNAESLSEVEDLYAPFKPGHKGTLAERARSLNLESVANCCISNPKTVNISCYVKQGIKGLSSASEVETGVKHIIADIIHHDKDVIRLVRDMSAWNGIMIESKQMTTTKKSNAKTSAKVLKAQENSFKFENYFEFRCPTKTIKPHQILAINRGEDNKILSVKVVIPEYIHNKFITFVQRKYLHRDCDNKVHEIVSKAIEDCWSRLVQPQMVRHIKSELTKSSQKSSIDVFSCNLKNLLLSPPVKGHSILGLDPGFKNGCKCAVVSQTGQVLHTGVVYLHNQKEMKRKLNEAVSRFRCKYIALGNGTACRETESVVSDIVKELSIKYCIVNEDGASIYSCSDLAKKEMPHLDPSLRGAVSIARRLLDPLAELVKIDPKNIGVGQYQHDIPENQLRSALDSVVEECVSFVGVDLNTGSESLLRRVAGLNLSKARKLIERREKMGPFTNRKQLKFVMGLGEKSYQQCAGFLRVDPSRYVTEVSDSENPDTGKSVGTDNDIVTISDDNNEISKGKKRKSKVIGAAVKKKRRKSTESSVPNPLDQTWIHPESYSIAERLMVKIGVKSSDLGKGPFVKQVKYYLKMNDVKNISKDLDTGEPTVQLIVDAFMRPIEYDIRDTQGKPLFKEGIRDIKSLRSGTLLTGKVTNVTHFGAFVDIGVGKDGLIHNSKMNRMTVQLGYRVEVRVENVDIPKSRIQLSLEKIL